MPKIVHPHLECRPSGFYFRRRIPSTLRASHAGENKCASPAQTGSVCLSLRTQFPLDAKRIARRLTAASDLLFAARTERDMTISANVMVAILTAVRDQEISSHDQSRAYASLRRPDDVEVAVARETAIQEALRGAIALGQQDTALPLLDATTRALGLVLDEDDPDFRSLTHHLNRLLIEISEERAWREAGDYSADRIWPDLASAQPQRPRILAFQSRRSSDTNDPLHGAFGEALPTAMSRTQAAPQPLPHTAWCQDVMSPAFEPEHSTLLPFKSASTGWPAADPEPQAISPQPSAQPTEQGAGTSKPMHPALRLPQEPDARKRALERALPDLRIDKNLFSDAVKESLLDPWSLRIDEAFPAYFEVKRAGYSDDFTKTQKRIPKSGEAWTRNSATGLDMARRIWVDLLGNCRIRDVTDARLDDALQKLARLPKLHGKVYMGKSYEEIIDEVDRLEIAQDAAANRAIETEAGLSEAQIEQLRLDAIIPRLRSETYLKHGRAMGRIGRFLEGLGLLERNPFALCAWTKNEEDQLKAQEDSRARMAWDDRIYELLRIPAFNGGTAEPGDPLFWAPLIALFNGPRLQEVLQLRPDDFGVEGGIPYMTVRNSLGNNVKSVSGERRMPVHPSLV